MGENNWKTLLLGEAVEVNPIRELKRGSIAKKVAMEDVTENQRKISHFTHTTFSGSGAKFRNQDTLLARITPSLENGKTAYVDILDVEETAFGSTEFIVLSPKKEISDPLYVYYVVRSPAFRQFAIKRMTGTSGRQRVPSDSLLNYKIDLPPIPEQRRIAHILGTLDDKIELNRRMNATLEAIARALFKSWFVDFDPVRAKLDGRPSGLPAEIEALFPDSFEESELGPIPRGWEVEGLGQSFEITMGQSPPGNTYNNEGIGLPFFQGRKDFGHRFPIERIYCSAPKRIVKPGDTLVSVRAPVGDINMAWEKSCIGRGVAGVRHKSGSRSFTFYTLMNLRQYLTRFEAEGTVFGSITKESFNLMQNIIPSGNLISQFEEAMYPLDELITVSHNEIQKLTMIRNVLLRRLFHEV